MPLLSPAEPNPAEAEYLEFLKGAAQAPGLPSSPSVLEDAIAKADLSPEAPPLEVTYENQPDDTVYEQVTDSLEDMFIDEQSVAASLPDLSTEAPVLEVSSEDCLHEPVLEQSTAPLEGQPIDEHPVAASVAQQASSPVPEILEADLALGAPMIAASSEKPLDERVPHRSQLLWTASTSISIR